MTTPSTSSDLGASGEDVAKPAGDETTNGYAIKISPEDSDAVSERFWSKVAKKGDAECWEWQACSKPQGYGRFHLSGRMQHAHRVAYALANGDVPANKHVMHTCDNRRCCNPAHLKVGSALENIRDMVEKNRHARGEAHGKAKLTSDMAAEIRTSTVSGNDLSEAYGVHPSVISSIRRRRHWRPAAAPLLGEPSERSYRMAGATGDLDGGEPV